MIYNVSGDQVQSYTELAISIKVAYSLEIHCRKEATEFGPTIPITQEET